ncbi:MAG: uracil phosphoribosyltransferase [Gemmataceae bacterium]
MPAPLVVSDHPLVLHKLARLRAADTPPPAFRELVYEISQVLFYEATRDVRLKDVTVRTPLADCPARVVADKIGLIPVLRAGLGMADAMLDSFPDAVVWHVGLYRDHVTLKPVEYYNKLPAAPGLDVALVLDPMLATGGSAIATLDILKRAGVPRLKFLGLIAAPEGVAALRAAHPDVPAYLAAVDERLNEVGYIVPGLGDAGDRQFNTL